MPNIEKSVDDLQPEEIVSRYYEARSQGDLESIKSLMTEQSYYMTLDSLGLKLAFKDVSFKKMLGSIEDDETSLVEVENTLSKYLLSVDTPYEIKIQSVEPNSTQRKTVSYTENGKVKNLYFSKESNGWKINYYAGRKVN